MIYIKTNATGRVVFIHYRPEMLGDTTGMIAVEAIPEPETRDGYIPELYYRNGQFMYEYVPVPEMEEEDPVQEPEVVPDPQPEPALMKFARMTVNRMGLSGEEALQVIELHPEWSGYIGKPLAAGVRIQHGGYLYEVRQDIDAVLSVQPPGRGTESLYMRVEASNAGTLDDPIPYSGNMEIFEGKYYIQDGIVYICIRSSGQPLQHGLSELVGIYVNAARR